MIKVVLMRFPAINMIDHKSKPHTTTLDPDLSIQTSDHRYSLNRRSSPLVWSQACLLGLLDPDHHRVLAFSFANHSAERHRIGDPVFTIEA